ncbi:MAG: hypothetical protein AB8B83_01680 [Bdellovibrionales bacterium]
MKANWTDVADKEYKILRGQTDAGYKVARISLLPQAFLLADSLVLSQNSNTTISLLMGLFSTLPLIAKAELRHRTLKQFEAAGDNLDRETAEKIIKRRQIGRLSIGYQVYHYGREFLDKVKDRSNPPGPPEP